jgi:hypothetical protein
MRLSVIFQEIAARRRAEADRGAAGEESRRIAATFAHLGAVSRAQEDAQIEALAERLRRKAHR